MKLKKSSSQEDKYILYTHALAAKDGEMNEAEEEKHAFEKNDRKVKDSWRRFHDRDETKRQARS